MEMIEAIRKRRSIRSFKPTPVPRKVLEELLENCLWSPSASNTQPCEFAILGGKVLEEVNTRLVRKITEEWDTERLTFKKINSDIPYPQLPEPYQKRAIQVRKHIDSHQFPPGTPGLDEKRAAYLHYGGRFYGAPSAIIIYTEKSICPKAILDIGMMAQTIALTALSYGLGTCLMSMPVWWPEIYRELLGISESKLIALAVAIGYPDLEAKVNTFERTREKLEVLAHWHGI